MATSESHQIVYELGDYEEITRWYWARPMDRDACELYVIRYMLRDSQVFKQMYLQGDGWKDMPMGGFMQPLLWFSGDAAMVFTKLLGDNHLNLDVLLGKLQEGVNMLVDSTLQEEIVKQAGDK